MPAVRPLALALAAVISLPVSALAQSATTTTDLHLRTGPGGQYAILATMPEGTAVPVLGCNEAATWCKVDYDGEEGFASAQYLLGNNDGTLVIISDNPSLFETIVLTPENVIEGTVIAILVPPPGPVQAVTPGPGVIQYANENPVSEQLVGGEIVVGAKVPDAVAVAPVPNHSFVYAYLNGRAVIIDPSTREIVHVAG